MAGRQFLVCLILAALAFSAQGDGRHWTDEEVQQEMLDWINRMQEKHEAKVQASKVTEVNFVTGVEPRDSDPDDLKIIVVDKEGDGDFESVSEAVEAIPDGATERYIIRVKEGTYHECVQIPSSKGPTTLQGSGAQYTKISYKINATDANGTLNSAVTSVESDHFIAKDIKFENTSPSPQPGAVGEQAVALEISGDKGAFYRCTFLGYQDTLYDRYGRHYFKDCHIRGTTDFIFGNGQSYYETCILESDAETFGSLAAQKRNSSEEDTGYSFVDCKVMGTGYLYLSRAWGPYSRVVFIKTYFGDIIRPEGWYNWGVPGREETVFYGEYKCFGPGANRTGREVWSNELTDEQVQPFRTVEWIDGKEWLPRYE